MYIFLRDYKITYENCAMTLREHRRTILRETLSVVASRAGVDLSVLSRVETKGKVSPYRVPAIARAYCMTVDAFETMLGGIKNENKKRAVRNAPRVSRGSAGNAAGRRGKGGKVSSSVD